MYSVGTPGRSTMTLRPGISRKLCLRLSFRDSIRIAQGTTTYLVLHRVDDLDAAVSWAENLK